MEDNSEFGEHEEELAQLVSQVADRLQRGEQVSLSQVCEEHPHLSQDLQEIWGTLVVADVAAAEARSSRNSHDRSSDTWSGISIPELPHDFGEYELLSVLGSGGMGIVYEARQNSLNRVVAIKMIRDNRASHLEHRQRFLSEAEANARLEHPGIVPVYEVGEVDGQPYFSMQLIEGETLSTRLKAGPIPQRQAAEMMIQVCRAIDFAHSRGVLHRDIKPSNILIDGEGVARVTDFGLAKFAEAEESLTRTGAVLGTPRYMSPEQASGRSTLDARSDVYSLGSVLYHVLTGRPPFIVDSPIELAIQILEYEPAPPRLIDPGIDRDMEMIVLKAIQKPSDLRYESAAALADDLEAFLRDEPVHARSGTLAQVAARWFRETHHASILVNWGLLWMWHSIVLLVVCLATEWMAWNKVESRAAYAALWVVGLGTWAAVFWALRRRMGPVTFVERQIAHVWGASLLAIAALTPIEWLLDLPPLTLSPMLAIVAAMVFFVKAGMLAGWFYIQSIALVATSIVMASFPGIAHIVFGLVSAACFFIPGLKYYRLRDRITV